MDNKKDTLTIPNLEVIPDNEYEFAKRIVDIIQRFNLLPDKIIPPDINLLNLINSKENDEVGIKCDGKIPYDALSYINWNAGIGTIGYGIRASGASPSAVIQYKHQGGSWANIGSGSGMTTLLENHTFRGNSTSQAVDTDVIKLRTTGIEIKNQIGFSTIFDNGNSGSSKTINWTNSNKQKITTTSNCTLTFTAPTYPNNLQLIMIHENSTVSYVYTYPGTVKWYGGVKITTTNTANAVDIISLFWDGTNYYTMGNINFS